MDIHEQGHLRPHINPNITGLEPSATVAINDLSNLLKKQGKEIFKLGLGQSPFPVPKPVVEELRRNAHQKDYLPVGGLPELQEAVAEHHYRNFGIKAHPEDILIGPGSKELMFILQLTYFGDLIIPAPSWVSYAPQAKIIGRNIFMVPTSPEQDWCLTAEQLDTLCRVMAWRPRLLILNYPMNPTGTTMSHKGLQELAEVADKHGILLLSDEIYGKLHHDGEHESIVPMYPEGTIFSGGLSKWCGAGGWRLGLFVFPSKLRWLKDAMAAVATETYTSTSAPIQYAAVKAFKGGEDIEDYLELSRKVLKAVGEMLCQRLEQGGAEVRRPKGGFYLFPDFSRHKGRLYTNGIYSSADMCRRLLEDTGVAILPGSSFGRPDQEFTARIAYVDFDGSAVLDAAAKVPADQSLDHDFVKTYCPKVVEAVDRINEWFSSL